MRVVLFGGDRTATCRVLKYMLEKNIDIVACVYEEQENGLLHELCEQYKILSYNAENMYLALKNESFPQFDLGISYLYRKILKKEIIKFANQNIINFHPAPTEVHRGVAACCYCLLNNYKSWAVTAHFVTEGIDDGDIILQRKFPLRDGLTGLEAEKLIQQESYMLFCDVLELFINNHKIPRKKQPDFSGVYYSKKQMELDKQVHMDDNLSTIDAKIKAFWFPPYQGAYIEIQGKKYSLVNEEIIEKINEDHKRLEES